MIIYMYHTLDFLSQRQYPIDTQGMAIQDTGSYVKVTELEDI